MSRREKIIVGLMAAAVLYGAYSFLLAGDSKSPLPTARPPQDLGSFVAGINERLSDRKVAERAGYTIERAAGEWLKDPFLRSDLGVTAEPEKEPEVDLAEQLGVHYTGYLAMGGRVLAVIGGMEYEVGESLEKGGYVIAAIGPQKVELRSAGNEQTVSLPLQEP